MASTVCLAAIGDTHLTRDDFHPSPPSSDAEAHDRGKYIANVEQTVRPLLATIRAATPDLLLHSGDLVEGARGEGGRAEMAWGLDLVRGGVGCPVALARGNHDRRDWFEAVVQPHLQAAFGAGAGPWAIDRGPVRVVVVDSQRCGSDELDRVADLFGDWPGWRLMMAHSPAFNVGRPFFRDRPFAELLLQRAGELGLHMVLCGHTHNTAVVSYDTGGWPLLQVMLSSIRWGDGPAVSLAAAKTWLVPPSRRRYAWSGRLENSPPLWLLAEASDQRLKLDLREVPGQTALSLALAPDGAVTELARADAAPPAPWSLSDVVRGWLCLSLYRAPARVHEVRLGDVLLARFPTVVPHYHHRTLLDHSALAAIGSVNDVTITGPGDDLVVGSLAVELELTDGSRRWSSPSVGVCAVGHDLAKWPEPQVVRAPSVAELPLIRLSFG